MFLDWLSLSIYSEMFVKDMDNSALSPSLSGDLDSTSSGGTVSDSANQSVMSPESYCSQILFNPNGRWFLTICIKLRRRAVGFCVLSNFCSIRLGCSQIWRWISMFFFKVYYFNYELFLINRREVRIALTRFVMIFLEYYHFWDNFFKVLWVKEGFGSII